MKAALRINRRALLQAMLATRFSNGHRFNQVGAAGGWIGALVAEGVLRAVVADAEQAIWICTLPTPIRVTPARSEAATRHNVVAVLAARLEVEVGARLVVGLACHNVGGHPAGRARVEACGCEG